MPEIVEEDAPSATDVHTEAVAFNHRHRALWDHASRQRVADLVHLNVAYGGSPGGVVRLCERFGALPGALSASASQLVAKGGLSQKRADALAKIDRTHVCKELERADRLGVRLVALGHDGYPQSLLSLDEPPLVLYVRGNIAALQQAPLGRASAGMPRLWAGIVGARRATRYGLDMSYQLAQGLVDAGVGVVSGLARGIDAAAHRGALDAGGLSVAVLANGLDRTYPPEHRALADQVASSGAVISELPLGTVPQAFQFPRRNRIVAGLCGLVCVVEAAQRSGSLITARLALEIGRDVFAVPGRVGDTQSAGCLDLLRDGAGLCCSVDDLLLALHVERRPAHTAGNPIPIPDEPTAQQIAAVLEANPADLDALVEATGASIGDIMAWLSNLEQLGAVRSLGGGLYARNGR